MAGIYIHIPFCKKACHYCNFHFSTQINYIDQFTKAIIKEIEIQKNYLSAPIETLYFGGGTPSLLPMDNFHKILDKLKSVYAFNSDIEFTIEANPDDIQPEQVNAWRKAGVNRLSIGIQSFQPAALQWMNRAHTSNQAHQAIRTAQREGIPNLSVDLIYGTPHLTNEDLMADLEIIHQYQIQHLSCYALTVEDKTALHKMIQDKKMAPWIRRTKQLILTSSPILPKKWEWSIMRFLILANLVLGVNTIVIIGRVFLIWALGHRPILIIKKLGNGMLLIISYILAHLKKMNCPMK